MSQGNGEAGEEEEEDFSSECENGTSLRRLSWSEVAGSQQTSNNNANNNRPLNPECQEFKLRQTPVPSDESQDVTALQTLQLEDDFIHPSSTITDDNTRLTTLILDPSASQDNRAISPEINRTTTPINVDTQRLPESYESLLTKLTSKRKYTRITRELTPGPDLDSIPVELAAIAVEELNEDSGFESQSSRRSDNKPLTKAVREWLSSADQGELFVNPEMVELHSDESDDEQPKNLHGNPMPALSVNEGDDGGGCRAVRRSKSKMKQSPRDSVAGVRVARDKNRKDKSEFVKSYESGEIMIGQDGRAVLNSDIRRQQLLVGIDEEVVDVMEFWEAETLSSVRPIEEVELQFERAKKYYALSRTTPRAR